MLSAGAGPEEGRDDDEDGTREEGTMTRILGPESCPNTTLGKGSEPVIEPDGSHDGGVELVGGCGRFGHAAGCGARGGWGKNEAGLTAYDPVPSPPRHIRGSSFVSMHDENS